ncbi:MAG: hypothetical protein AMXMBFR33_07900 [Candidatus Xenobia bacterium]
MAQSLARDQSLWRRRQSKLPQTELDSNLPGAYHAEIDLIRGIKDRISGRDAQGGVPPDEPEKRAGIQKVLQ